MDSLPDNDKQSKLINGSDEQDQLVQLLGTHVGATSTEGDDTPCSGGTPSMNLSEQSSRTQIVGRVHEYVNKFEQFESMRKENEHDKEVLVSDGIGTYQNSENVMYLGIHKHNLNNIDIKTQQKSQDDNRCDAQNDELAQRFHKIMRMFDDYTKNLKSFSINFSSSNINVFSANNNDKSITKFPQIGHAHIQEHKHREFCTNESLSPEAVLEREIVRKGYLLSSPDLNLPDMINEKVDWMIPAKDIGNIIDVNPYSKYSKVTEEKPSTSRAKRNKIGETETLSFAAKGVTNANNNETIECIFEPKSINVHLKPDFEKEIVEAQPPCELTYHTIHIDTTSSPSSSTMRRPPLRRRCWNILASFFNTMWLCVQINRDCIFCIGFFIAFVVSASFLTAFFYRTLSVTPKYVHTHYTATENDHFQKHQSSQSLPTIHHIPHDNGRILFQE